MANPVQNWPGWNNQFDPTEYEQRWNAFASMNPYEYNIIDDLSNPFLRQHIEWSQQMVATQYQNWYKSAPVQMALMKEAGINPYLAANGIAGASGNSSVASPPASAVGQGANSLGAISNAVKAFGGFAGDAVQAFDTLKTLSHRNKETDAHTKELLSNSGFLDSETDGILIDNSYKRENWIAELNIKRQQFTNMQNDFDLVKKQREYIEKQLLWYDQQMLQTLAESESKEILNERMAFLIDQQKIAQDLENQWTQKYWSHIGDPAMVALKNLALRAFYEDDPEAYFEKGYQQLIKYYQDKADKEFEMQFGHQAASSWNSRPSNAFEATAYIGTQLANLAPKLFDLIKNGKASLTEIRSNKEAREEFDEMYDEAKSNLYSTYRAARREYRSAKYSSASDSYKYETKRKMEMAKKEYDEFTPEKFSEMLINQYTGKDKIQ